MTRQAALVDELLASSSEFRTAQDLYAQLRASGAKIGQTTVYRHLQLLVEQGSVDVIRTPTGEAAYRSCGGTGHHHHLICRCCSRTVELAGPEVERWLARVTSQAGFTDISHTLEIVGTCDSCAR
jgi:Fur family ferric uptake transcriptional regulator